MTELPKDVKDWCTKNNLDEVMVGLIYRNGMLQLARDICKIGLPGAPEGPSGPIFDTLFGKDFEEFKNRKLKDES
jgi:hypothetical protein